MNDTNVAPAWLGCLLIGAATASLGISLRPMLAVTFEAVERDLTDKLRRLRTRVDRLHFYLISWSVATAVVFLGFWFVLNSLVFAVVAAALMLSGPWYLLRQMAQRHRQKIEDQLADAMVMLANAVRAGLSLAQSLDILAAQCPRPINAEFRQIVAEYNMGKPLEQTLREAKERLHSENFALFAAGLMASHESGGRLNEIVERIAQSVLELQRLERKILVETAQARKSAIYMAVAPVFILTVYYFVDPDNTRLLFHETIGHVIIATAFVFDVAAYLWARLILSPEI